MYKVTYRNTVTVLFLLLPWREFLPQGACFFGQWKPMCAWENMQTALGRRRLVFEPGLYRCEPSVLNPAPRCLESTFNAKLVYF